MWFYIHTTFILGVFHKTYEINRVTMFRVASLQSSQMQMLTWSTSSKRVPRKCLNCLWRLIVWKSHRFVQSLMNMWRLFATLWVFWWRELHWMHRPFANIRPVSRSIVLNWAFMHPASQQMPNSVQIWSISPILWRCFVWQARLKIKWTRCVLLLLCCVTLLCNHVIVIVMISIGNST